MAATARTYERARDEVIEMKHDIPLLGVVDQSRPVGDMIDEARDELVELKAAVDLSPTRENLRALADEFCDVFMWLMVIGWTQAPHLDVTPALGRANGAGRHSGVFDELEEVLVNLPDDVEKALLRLVALTFSLLEHSAYPDALETMPRTIGKIGENKPKALYNPYSVETGQVITDRDVLRAKLRLLQEWTRTLREIVGRRLQRSDWNDPVIRYYAQLVEKQKISKAVLDSIARESHDGMVVVPPGIEVPSNPWGLQLYGAHPVDRSVTVFDASQLRQYTRAAGHLQPQPALAAAA